MSAPTSVLRAHFRWRSGYLRRHRPKGCKFRGAVAKEAGWTSLKQGDASTYRGTSLSACEPAGSPVVLRTRQLRAVIPARGLRRSDRVSHSVETRTGDSGGLCDVLIRKAPIYVPVAADQRS